MEEGAEKALGLTQRLPLHRTQTLHSLDQGRELLLELERWKTHDQSLDVLLVDAGLIDRVPRKCLNLLLDERSLEVARHLGRGGAFCVQREAHHVRFSFLVSGYGANGLPRLYATHLQHRRRMMVAGGLVKQTPRDLRRSARQQPIHVVGLASHEQKL